MLRRELCKAALGGLFLALAGDALPAGDLPVDCYADSGVAAPKALQTTVVLIDATTALTTVQKQQTKELLHGQLRNGHTVVMYVFGRTAGLESVQRLGTFRLPEPVDDGWRLAPRDADKINTCLRDSSREARARAHVAIQAAVEGYVRASESAIVQAISQTVASHPGVGHVIVVSDGVQHQANGGYTLYDMARGGQTIRGFDPVKEAERVLLLGKPALTQATRITMFPIAQVEPSAGVEVVRRRLAAEIDRLLELWTVVFRKAGGRPSVTSFVPTE